MPHPIESPEMIYLQSKRVIQSGSIVQPSSNQHLFSPLRSAHLAVVEVLIPFGEVPNTRGDRSVAGDDPFGHIDVKSSLAVLRIPDGAVCDNLEMIVMHLRGAHVQRHKNVFGQELAEWLAGHSLHYQGHQEVTGIAVGMLLSRIEIEVLLTAEHFQRLLIVDDRLILSAAQRNKRVVVAKTTGVMNQMPESDSSTIGRKFWDDLADVVIQRKFPTLSEQNNRRRRELLGNRADVKRCIWRNCCIAFQICDAETSSVNGLTVSENANCTAGSVRLIPRREN